MNLRSLGLFILAFASLSFGQTQSRHYAGPHLLGPYDLEGHMPVDSMFKLLNVVPTSDSPICFRSTDGTYMWIERMGMETAEERRFVGGLLLSNFPNCVRNPVHLTREAVGKWKTKEGIGLGSTKQSIITTYGKPSEDKRIKGDSYLDIIVGGFQSSEFTVKPKPDIGDEVLEYTEAGSLLSAEFGMRRGIVVWLEISKNE